LFSYIYLDNLSPAKLSGFWPVAVRNELAVDNFFTEKILSKFKAQTAKSIKS